MINIRHTEIADLPAVMGVYAHARAMMKQTGNPDQWRDSYPPERLIIDDIKNRNSYVIEQNGEICGVFFFRIGEDPTYRRIDGQWLCDAPYGVIHRIAGNGRMKGVFPQCVAFCAEKIANLRVDTHHDNKLMQHQIEKCGFTRCGIIYLEDGSPRIAYQRVSGS